MSGQRDDAPGLSLSDADGTLTVVGDLDSIGGRQLDAALLNIEDSGRSVQLDLAAVTFVDSTGLRSLLAASRRAEVGGRRVHLVRMSTVVRRLLDLTATSSLFDLDDELPLGDVP
jgi:anti-sigma B factor antagonist